MQIPRALLDTLLSRRRLGAARHHRALIAAVHGAIATALFASSSLAQQPSPPPAEPPEEPADAPAAPEAAPAPAPAPAPTPAPSEPAAAPPTAAPPADATLSADAPLGLDAVGDIPAETTTDVPVSNPGVDEVIVTVDRRKKDLQDYSGTAAAFSEAKLTNLGLSSVADLSQVVPGLQIGSTTRGATVYIRGVGSDNTTELGDPAVAVHVDNVYLPRFRGLERGVARHRARRGQQRPPGYAARPQRDGRLDQHHLEARGATASIQATRRSPTAATGSAPIRAC